MAIISFYLATSERNYCTEPLLQMEYVISLKYVENHFHKHCKEAT